ncbi:MAG TPA: CHAT domain-containing protein [Candidatus Polarisedimenticolaceae bacterium]|nr:CHAT domain-containing protein [Candidatus Polarisedimenticolaceae bacterium]
MRASSRPALIAVALAAAACRVAGRSGLIADPAPVFRGHRDIDVAGAAAPVPRVIGRSAPIGFCLDAPPQTDTSQWEARVLDGTFVRPVARLDTTVCFEAPIPASLADGTRTMCAVLRDRFDGETQSLPCLPFRLETDDGAIAELDKRIPSALAKGASALESLSDDAKADGYTGLAFRAKLIAAYALRRDGSDSARAEATLLLRDDPPWVRSTAGLRWAGPLDYERASLALDARADLAGCWRLLRTAERSFRLSGDRKWIAVAGKQAEVLSRAGALGEAKERLRFAVSVCGTAPCDPSLVRSVESTWAWLVASDPDSSPEEIDAATRRVAAIGSEAPASQDKLEQANVFLNLAFLEVRAGRAPVDALARARGLIGNDASARAHDLAAWADLAEARRDMDEGDAHRALAACGRIDAAAASPRVRAFAASATGAALRKLRKLEQASASYAKALALHAASNATRLDDPLGPSPWAEDAYAAARVEVEGGRPEEAWAILEALDEDRETPPRPAPVSLEPWLALLAELERPASSSRREERDAIRWSALDRMREAIRSHDAPSKREQASTDYRAFPVDVEVIVLRRTEGGRIVTYRRTPFSRAELVARISAVRDALERGDVDDARWDQLVEPLGRALAPRAEDLAAATAFAMHGILQDVPLAALRIPADAARRWLGEVTAPVHRTAIATPVRRESAAGGAVVVSDPRGDLGATAAWSGGPATILRGEGATRDALRRALSGAALLHVDAHAHYEPAFPELSTIVLADGVTTGQELAAWGPGLVFANLSGCATGRAPVSADSGRFGIAGLLARSGVPWVVAARAPLADALAAAFNRAFYAALAGGGDVPHAYRSGLEAVRRRSPASRWGAWVLLSGADADRGGQTADARTPHLAGGLR